MNRRLAAVVVPAHDEAAALPACLTALSAAADLAPCPVRIVVVLDACSDDSRRVVDESWPHVDCLEVDEHGVGGARAAGFRYARQRYRADGLVDDDVWFATTDADSRVDDDWLVRQLQTGADMVLGVVRLADRRHLPRDVVRRYVEAYRTKMVPGGHRHVHGANMGMAAECYWNVGGFSDLTTGEDVDLVRRFEREGLAITRDADLSVATSARRTGRAPQGFAAHLRAVGRRKPREPA